MALNDAENYYSFNDADLTGSNPDDLGTLNVDGTTTGATTGATGILDEGFSFDGTDDLVDIGDGWRPISASTWTASVWVKTSDTGINTIWNCVNGTGRGMGLHLDDDKIVFTWQRYASNRIIVNVDGTNVNNGSWHHIVVKADTTSGIDASDVLMYLDGSSQSLTTAADSLTGTTVTTQNMHIGDESGSGNNHFNGDIDELGFWDREISASEVADLYNSGTGFNPYAPVSGADWQINIGDVWKEGTAMQINIGDVWKSVSGAQINIGDVWKTIF